jgi:hypothetical protein
LPDQHVVADRQSRLQGGAGQRTPSSVRATDSESVWIILPIRDRLSSIRNLT